MVEVDLTKGNAAASFENVYARTTGTLTIQKQIPAADWEKIPNDYSVTLTWAGKAGTATAGRSGSKEFAKTAFHQSGSFYVASYAIADLPYGEYTIGETADSGKVDGYNKTVSGTGDVTLNTAAKTVAVTNSYAQKTGTLTIHKTVPAQAGVSADTEFTFYIKRGTQTVATVQVKANESESVPLAWGTYTIEEVRPANTENYNFSDVTFSGTGVTDGGSSARTATLVFHPEEGAAAVEVTAENQYTIKTDGKLTITKTVTGTGAPRDAQFAFTVKLGSSSTDHGSETTYQGDGIYTFTLSNGESATITGIPRGTDYKVTETGVMVNGQADATALREQYETTVPNNHNGVISNGTIVTVTTPTCTSPRPSSSPSRTRRRTRTCPARSLS